MAMSEDADLVREALWVDGQPELVYTSALASANQSALAALVRLEARLAENARKVEAYDAARATVKREGNSRAYYVLRAEAAEALLKKIRQWDMLDVAADGPYWKRTIDEYFGEV